MPAAVITIDGKRVFHWLAVFCFANFTLFSLHTTLEISARSQAIELSFPVLAMAMGALFAVSFGISAPSSKLRNGFLMLALIFAFNPYIFSAHAVSVLGFLIATTSLVIGITCAQQARLERGFNFNSFIHGVALLALLGVIARYAPLATNYEVINAFYQTWQHTFAVLGLALGLLLLSHELASVTPLLRPNFTVATTFILAIALPILLVLYWQQGYFTEDIRPLDFIIEATLLFLGTFTFGMLLSQLPHLRWNGTVEVIATPRK